MRVRTLYDVMDQDTLVQSIGPAMVHPLNATNEFQPRPTVQEKLTVRNVYDAEGNLLQVDRWATPDTAEVGTISTTYEYDRAGRKVREAGPDWETQIYSYDPAANLTNWRTKRGLTITMGYDALGRLTRRTVPGVTYNATACTQWMTCAVNFPAYPNMASGGYTVPEDIQYYTYDVMGNQLRGLVAGRAGAGEAFGSVSYTHAGGIDRPLAILKTSCRRSSRTRTGARCSATAPSRMARSPVPALATSPACP